MRRYRFLTWIFTAAIIPVAVLSISGVNAAGFFAETGRAIWSKEELGILASLSLKRLPAMPFDPSNTVERLPAAIDLGKQLFNDPRLSRSGNISCASCHNAAKQFQDGLPVGKGIGTGSRRTMPIIGSGYSNWLFWDGRKDSLWSQALGPLEDPAEHGGNRTRYARMIAENYHKEYEGLFGPIPKLDDLPMDAGPNGNDVERAAWAAMSKQQRNDVSRVFSNIGKAIAAFEKSIQPEPSRLDRYIDSVIVSNNTEKSVLNSNEIRGLKLFIGKAQCISCHNGPLFSDQHFHNTGVPPRNASSPDLGRAAATSKVLSDEFNCLGPFSDAPASQCQELKFMVIDDPSLKGAFKTPSLRGVSERPPYMHAGQFSSLNQVVRHYIQAPKATIGRSELLSHREGRATDSPIGREPINLTDSEAADLLAFLSTLSVEN